LASDRIGVNKSRIHTDVERENTVLGLIKSEEIQNENKGQFSFTENETETKKQDNIDRPNELSKMRERRRLDAFRIFDIPIHQWGTEEWITVFVMFMLVSLAYNMICCCCCRGGISFCEILQCWCCYELFCAPVDPDPIYALC
jgi:hypothetical protein